MKILINYHYLAAYREGIVNYLKKSSKCDFKFSAGSYANANIRLIDNAKVDYTFQNYWFRNFCFQKFPLSFLNRFDAIIMLGNPNLVYVWFILIYNTFFRKTKIILWTHGYYENDSFIIQKVRNTLYGMSDGVMFYNNHAKDIGDKRLKVPTETIYNSLPNYDYIFTTFSDEGLIKRKMSNSVRLVYIGRLTEQKNIAYYVEYCRKLNRPLELHIIGSGPQYSILQEMAQSHCNDIKIKLYGEVFDEIQISEVLSISHLCITPVNIGLTAIHAMSYGIPIFSCRDWSAHGPEYEAMRSTKIPIGFDSMDDFIPKLNFAIDYIIDNLPSVVKSCRAVVKEHWNPHFQHLTIEQFVRRVVYTKKKH